MKQILLVLLLAPCFCFGQKASFISETRTDTIISCGKKYLVKTSQRTLANSEKTFDVSDFVVLRISKPQNDTVLALKSLNETELRSKFQDSEEKDYSERIYYDQVSENILEIINAKSHYFEGAAHGEHWYENSFFDLKTRSSFDLKDVLEEAAYPVIHSYIQKELNLESMDPVPDATKPKRYSFDKKNLVISFHYLDADSPVPVSYAEQRKEVYIPFSVLIPFLKPESPVFKMIHNQECN